jgi:hypothetical protein
MSRAPNPRVAALVRHLESRPPTSALSQVDWSDLALAAIERSELLGEDKRFLMALVSVAFEDDVASALRAYIAGQPRGFGPPDTASLAAKYGTTEEKITRLLADFAKEKGGAS